MKGIQNFLYFINENYVLIMVCIGLIFSIISKVKSFIGKSDEEKIKIAKDQIREIMLKMIADAEYDYAEWNKSGALKRSQVIEKIYEKYPILSKVIDQTEVVAWIDSEIDNSLLTLNNLLKNAE